MLLKAIEAPSGAVATYWHRVRATLTDDGLEVVWHGFLDRAAFLAGKGRLDQRSAHVGPDVLYSEGMPTAEISGVITQISRAVIPEFADAEDAPAA